MKKSVIYIVAALSAAILLGSCATTKKSDVYATIYSEKPEVFLIMPPINNSNYVEAKDCFYSTMNVPLAEAGYYVLPPAAGSGCFPPLPLPAGRTRTGRSPRPAPSASPRR